MIVAVMLDTSQPDSGLLTPPTPVMTGTWCVVAVDEALLEENEDSALKIAVLQALDQARHRLASAA